MRNDGKGGFLSNPKIVDHFDFLGEIGVLSYVIGLTEEIRSYETLFSRGLDIFNRTSIDDILEATVQLLSDFYLPSFIAFVWKPIQNRMDITMRSYRDYKPINLDLKLDSIDAFASFFSELPKPVAFAEMEEKLGGENTIALLRDVRPEIVVPIMGPSDLYGIILVGRKTAGGDYNDEEMKFLQQFMFIVSQAIKNHLHYEHSLHDIKTGLYNHGFFMTRVKEEISRARRSDCVSSIIVIDVDKFKNFNDTYGHLAGDQVLTTLAQAIRQNVRDDDIPSRFGGEEFTVLLPRTDISTALGVAERLRISVSEMDVPWEVPLPKITISLGVFSFDSSSTLKTNDVIRRADEALYVSKANGRNCTTVWEPSMSNVKYKECRG